MQFPCSRSAADAASWTTTCSAGADGGLCVVSPLRRSNVLRLYGRGACCDWRLQHAMRKYIHIMYT